MLKDARTAAIMAMIITIHVQSAVAVFGITSAAGVVQTAAPPLPSVNPGVTEGDLPIIFPEVLNALVFDPAGLPVDHDGSTLSLTQAVSGNVVNPALIGQTLPYNTAFNSYLFHFDPVLQFASRYNSTIEFDNPIIGVQLFSNNSSFQKPSGFLYVGNLDAGDSEVIFNNGPLGVPAVFIPTYYPTSVSRRGVEDDSLSISISGNIITLSGHADFSDQIDHVRILTATVPEPSTLFVLGIGAISLLGHRKAKSPG